MAEALEDKLMPVATAVDWTKVMGILAMLVLINVVAFLVSFGFGVIVTVPLTLFLGFLLLRNMMPRHRFPRGRQVPGADSLASGEPVL